MGGSEDLEYLQRESSPVLDPDRYVFVCRPAIYGDHPEWQPIATFAEAEGLTMVLSQRVADQYGLSYGEVFKKITFTVQSSLTAVGWTAKFTECLTANQISANVFAGFHHDHVFVPLADADRAMTALESLAPLGSE